MIKRAARCLYPVISLAPLGAVAVETSYGGPSYAEATPLASAEAFPTAIRDTSGWMSSEWFGWWWDAFDPWLFHAEHGWIFQGSGNEGDGLMFYDTHLGTWVATQMANYSWFYAFGPINDWIYYSRPGVAGGRWYYRASTGGWEHEADLRLPKSIAFDNADSDVAALFQPAVAGAPTLVVLRHPESGTARHLVFVNEDGGLLEFVADAAGRMGQITVGDHLFVFSDYTETTARMVYHAPDGSTTEQVVSIEPNQVVTMAARSKIMLANVEADESIDATIKDAAEWLSDPSNSHLALNIWRVAGEAVYNVFEPLAIAAEEFVAEAETVGRKVKNEVACLTETGSLCAQELAKKTPELIKGLDQLDPNSETTAGIEVSANSVKPKRADWDPLILNGQVNPDTLRDTPCEESVFASMNPDCSEYVPPQEHPTNPPEGALQAHDLILFTPMDTPITQELGASGATGYEVVTYPSTGTLVLDNPATGEFTYLPADGYEGSISFTFVALNADKRSNEAVVTINISACKEYWTEVLVGQWKVTGMPASYPLQDYTLIFTMKENGFGQQTLYLKETYTRNGYPGSSLDMPPTIVQSTWGEESGCWLSAKFLLLSNTATTVQARLHSDFYEPKWVDVTFTKQ